MMDEYREHSAAENEIFSEAVSRFDQREEEFFGCISSLAQKPYDSGAVAAFNQSSVETQDAFVEVIKALASDEELSVEERANSIATWYFTAEQKRMKLLRELAPDGDYNEGDATHEQVIENITDLFNAGMDADEIGAGVGHNYELGLAEDIEALRGGIELLSEPAHKDKAVGLAKDIGAHAIQLGRLAAGVALGTFIAQRALKKFKN